MSPIIPRKSKLKTRSFVSKVYGRRGTVQISVDAVVAEPCPHIKSPKETESGPEIPPKEVAVITYHYES